LGDESYYEQQAVLKPDKDAKQQFGMDHNFGK
jgi:hypothetical protein